MASSKLDVVDRDHRSVLGGVGDREVPHLEDVLRVLRPRGHDLGAVRVDALPLELAQPQRGARDLVERVVEQRERRAEEGDADAGHDRPVGHPGPERLVVLGPVEHRPPALAVRVAEPDELQAGGEEHGVERGAEEARQDQRGHRRQDLVDDHVRLALAAHAGRLEEVARAQRERLRAQLPGAVRPAEHAEHDHEREQPGVPLVGRDHDDQREDRDHQDHVGDQREDPVGRAAEVAGGDADDHRDHRRQAADEQRDQERLARPEDELREDVLAVGGRPEQVVERRPEPGRVDLRPRVVRRDLARDRREHDEDEQQPEPDEGLLVAEDRAEEVGADAAPGRLLRRAGADGRAGRLDRVRDRGERHPRSRVRGSRIAVAMSAARIASRTVTVIRRKSACISA